MRDRDTGVQHAVREAITLRNRTVVPHTRLRDRVIASGDPATSRYARDLGHIARGNLLWSDRTARYRADGRRGTLAVTSRPDGIDTSPITLPATEWWWRQL
ncbi:hypothetical protein ACFVFS_14075 [Kitasatospora sp. NPDC057692]|uniref:hypothetical protein n=1 Tax=Kitasatospora sp. NPDC057692 TaxID=3346215 RepID=UPI00368C06D4